MNSLNPRRFVAMLIKESLQILRDPASLLIAFALTAVPAVPVRLRP